MSCDVSRFRAERLLLGCASEGAVLLSRQPASPAAAMLASVRSDRAAGNTLAGALSGLVQDLDPRLAAASPASLCVTLDDALSRNFLVTPPAGAQGLGELRATAAARFAALYGEPAEQWVLAADWHATAPFVTCALPRELYRAINELARSHAWRLESLCPALLRVWNRVNLAIPADGWLLVGFGQTLTLAHTRSGRIASLRSLRLGSAPDLAELATLIEQERLRSPADAETHARQSLLWTGTAGWLPTAATIAGLTSRRIPAPGQGVPIFELPPAYQLALAGSER